MKSTSRATNPRHGALWIVACALALAASVGTPGWANAQTTYVVSPTGDDRNPGTVTEPFRTVQRGVDALGRGDTLVLRAGRYLGPVLIAQKSDVTIVAASRESVSIDGYVPLISEVPSRPPLPPTGPDPVLWVPARQYDASADAEEFVSTRRFDEDRVNRGAFLEVKAGVPSLSHTRLISYSRLEDLRAHNETWEPFTSVDDARFDESAEVFIKCGAKKSMPHAWHVPTPI